MNSKEQSQESFQGQVNIDVTIPPPTPESLIDQNLVASKRRLNKDETKKVQVVNVIDLESEVPEKKNKTGVKSLSRVREQSDSGIKTIHLDSVEDYYDEVAKNILKKRLEITEQILEERYEESIINDGERQAFKNMVTFMDNEDEDCMIIPTPNPAALLDVSVNERNIGLEEALFMVEKKNKISSIGHILAKESKQLLETFGLKTDVKANDVFFKSSTLQFSGSDIYLMFDYMTTCLGELKRTQFVRNLSNPFYMSKCEFLVREAKIRERLAAQPRFFQLDDDAITFPIHDEIGEFIWRKFKDQGYNPETKKWKWQDEKKCLDFSRAISISLHHQFKDRVKVEIKKTGFTQVQAENGASWIIVYKYIIHPRADCDRSRLRITKVRFCPQNFGKKFVSTPQPTYEKDPQESLFNVLGDYVSKNDLEKQVQLNVLNQEIFDFFKEKWVIQGSKTQKGGISKEFLKGLQNTLSKCQSQLFKDNLIKGIFRLLDFKTPLWKDKKRYWLFIHYITRIISYGNFDTEKTILRLIDIY